MFSRFRASSLLPIPYSVSQPDRRNPRAAISASRSAYLIRNRLPIGELVREMDTSNPAVLVNGELLGLYIGKKVRTVIQVLRSEKDIVHGKSADDQQLIVKGAPPSSLTPFVEVIGTAESPQSIHAEKWHNFGETFDMSNYNQLCKLANGEYKQLFL